MKKNLFLIACGLFALMVSAYPQSFQKSQYGKQGCYVNDSLVEALNRHEDFVSYKVSGEFPFSMSVYPEYGDLYMNIFISKHFSYFSKDKKRNVCMNPTGDYVVMKWVNDSSLYVGEFTSSGDLSYGDTAHYEMYDPLNGKNCDRFKTFASKNVNDCWRWMVAEMFRGNTVSLTLKGNGKKSEFICKSFYF